MGYHYFSGYSSLHTVLSFYQTIMFFWGIAAYVLSGIGMYSMANNTGMKNPWMAWVPFCREYLLGSMADRYNANVTGRQSKLRIWLTVVNAVQLPIVWLGAFFIAFSTLFTMNSYHAEEAILSMLGGVLLLLLIVLALVIACTVLYLICFYKTFQDYEPSRAAGYTVAAFFGFGAIPLFISRNNVPVGVSGHYEPKQPHYNVNTNTNFYQTGTPPPPPPPPYSGGTSGYQTPPPPPPPPPQNSPYQNMTPPGGNPGYQTPPPPPSSGYGNGSASGGNSGYQAAPSQPTPPPPPFPSQPIPADPPPPVDAPTQPIPTPPSQPVGTPTQPVPPPPASAPMQPTVPPPAQPTPPPPMPEMTEQIPPMPKPTLETPTIMPEPKISAETELPRVNLEMSGTEPTPSQEPEPPQQPDEEPKL